MGEVEPWKVVVDTDDFADTLKTRLTMQVHYLLELGILFSDLLEQ